MMRPKRRLVPVSWMALLGVGVLMAPPAASAAPDPQLATGWVAPMTVQLRDLRGKAVDLGLLCGPAAKMYNPTPPKGLLIDFYMTSCVPCNKALPMLGELAAKLKPAGLRTLLVSLDGTEQAAAGGVSNTELRDKLAPAKLGDEDVIRDPGQVLAEDFRVLTREPGRGPSVSVPRTFLLDEQCKVRAVYTNIDENLEAAETLFQELIAPPPQPPKGKQGKAPKAGAVR